MVDSNTEFICSPSDPNDCYPQIFVPTDQWQSIREGQDIPGGLHVRMNMETGLKEAKLLEDEGEEGTKDTGLVIQETEQDASGNDKSDEIEADILQKIQEHKQQQLKMHEQYQKSRVTLGDVKQFDAAVEEVLFASPLENLGKISVALDTLEDLSHDIEFGVKLSSDKEVFGKLLHLGENLGSAGSGSDLAALQDKAYRIMAGSLRNNPEAVSNVLTQQSTSFVDALFAELEKTVANVEVNSATPAGVDILQKRILGIISAFTQDPNFKAKYFSYTGAGLLELISIFPQLGPQSQTRLMNILEDNQLYSGKLGSVSNLKRAVEDSIQPEAKYSKFLQQQLSDGKIGNEEQLRLYFKNLCQVHESNKNLKPTSDFLEWLAKEATIRTDPSEEKRELLSEDDKKFGKHMLQARHLIFGNPNAMRKALADEL